MRWQIKPTLLFLILIGLILRLWGTQQELPFHYYGDESTLIYQVLKFGTGDLNPHSFIWPTLFQYVLFFLFITFYILGVILGWFKNTADFLYLYLKDPTVFFLIGRITSAMLGTATIFWIYILAKKIYNDENVSLISIVIFTLLPLAVEYSHYAVTDTALLFMILASFILIINAFFYSRLRDYILSGFLIGLSTGTKYPAVLLTIPLCLAHFLKYKKLITYRIAISLLFIFLGFFLSTPFAILDFPKFLSDIKSQILCARIGWRGWERTNTYIYHLTYNLKGTLGIPLLIFSLISLLYVLIRRENKELIVASFPIIYFLLIGLDKNNYPRFMLPILPFLVIFSAKLLADLKRREKLLSFIFLICLLLEPLVSSIKIDLRFSLPSTMTLAKNWIEKNIPEKSKILLNEGGPPLVQSPEKIRIEFETKPKEFLRYGYHSKRDLFYRIKEKISEELINYDLSYISSPIGYLEGKPEYEWLMKKNQQAIENWQDRYDFVIITDAPIHKLLSYPRECIPIRYLRLRNFYEDIMKNYQPIKVFAPIKNKIQGPVIRIYKLK